MYGKPDAVDSVCGSDVGMPTVLVVNMATYLAIWMAARVRIGALGSHLERGVRQDLFEPCRVVIGRALPDQRAGRELAGGGDRGSRVVVARDL